MEQRKRYLKLAALVPAVVLVGGFVGVQAGVLPPLAIPGFSKPTPEPEPQPQPEPAAATQSPAPPQDPHLLTESDPTFMAGSKTIIFSKPPGTQSAGPPNTATPAPAPPVFIGGSKSKPIVTIPPTPNPPAPPKP